MTKEQVLETVRQLPDGFVLEDLFERLLFVERLETRLAMSDRSKAVPFDEARVRFQSIEKHRAA